MSDPTRAFAGNALPPELDPRRGRGRPPGPPPGGRPPVTLVPRRGRSRLLSWIAVATSALILVTSGLGWFLFEHYNGNITRRDVFGALRGDRPAASGGRSENFLIVGSDTRAGVGDSGPALGGPDEVTGARSDTTILVHLSARRDKALLVSIPRDSYVQIPDCVDDQGRTHAPVKDKFNTAFAIGGAPCTIRTVENLTDVHVDHYLEVDFAGFKNMVAALGGVDVCMPKAVQDKNSGLNLPAGVSHVDGDQALAFVRARYALGDGSDLGRIQRQQQFLGAMMRKATSTGLLLRPDRLLSFLQAATNSMTADQQFTFNDMKDLALKLRGLDPSQVTFVTVPVSNTNYPVKGIGSTVLWDQSAAEELFRAVRTDDAIPGASPAPSVQPGDLVVPPARVRVRVLNGSGATGAANKAAEDLRRVGFVVVDTGNADAASYRDTVVRFGSDRADSARTLAAALPGSKLQPDESLGSTVELVVGSSYAGARSVTVSTAPAPGPGPAASPPAAITAAQDACASS